MSEQDLVGAAGVVVEVGTAADHVGTGVERLPQQGALRGSGEAGDGPGDEGHDLEVDRPAEPFPGLDEALHGAQTLVEGGVGVRADGGDPARHQHAGSSLRPFRDVVDGQGVAIGVHDRDRPLQVTAGVDDPIGQEGLVEVGVGFDGGGQQEVAVELDHSFRWVGGGLAAAWLGV